MRIRAATPADEATIRALWDAMAEEVPAPPEHAEPWEEEWADVVADIEGRGVALLAEDDEGVAGLVRASGARGVWEIVVAYTVPRARRQGVMKRLLAQVLEEGRGRGVSRVVLQVLASNDVALAVWRRLGFEPSMLELATDVDSLESRLRAAEPSHGSVYVQTDDHAAIERAVRGFIPRLGRSAHTEIAEAGNGWIEVRDELCSREPSMLRRLGRELSDRTGAPVVQLGVEEGAVVRYVMYDRGRVADEYASLPEYHGPLPPGDVVALGANPTVAARLTGADPARVRQVVRSAASGADLPPPDELLEQIRDVLGLPS